MVRVERLLARLYVRHYSTTLRILAKKIILTQTSRTYTDFREPCSHHPALLVLILVDEFLGTSRRDG